MRLIAAAAVFALALAVACGDDGDNSNATPTPDGDSDSVTATPEPGTPAPADPALARQVFDEFVEAVQDDDLETAWSLYVASVPGDEEAHNGSLGCSRQVFGGEFPNMQNMFDRIAPLSVDQVFGGASRSPQVELQLTGADGSGYLATLLRDPPSAPYRLRFFNSGRVAAQPGVPDPFPSPEDPRGFCGIWTGPR